MLDVTSKDKERDRSCVMGVMPKAVADKASAFSRLHIPDEWLTSDGREDKFHVTLKYSILTDDLSQVEKHLPKKPIKCVLGKVNAFRKKDDVHVLIVDVHGEELEKAHKELSKLENDDEHPQFHGHMSLAYVLPGKGTELEGDDTFEGIEVEITQLDWSPKGDGDGRQVIEIGEPVEASLNVEAGLWVDEEVCQRCGHGPRNHLSQNASEFALRDREYGMRLLMYCNHDDHSELKIKPGYVQDESGNWVLPKPMAECRKYIPPEVGADLPLSIEGMLVHGGIKERLPILIQQFYKDSDPQEAANEIMMLAQADPTGDQGKYLTWIIKNRTMGMTELGETDEIKDLLAKYHKVKNKAGFPPEAKDINRLKYNDLVDIVKQYEGLKTQRELELEGQNVVRDDQNYKIIQITTPEAAARLCAGKNWCIKDPKFSTRYLEDGPLYLVENRYKDQFMIHPSTGEVKDLENQTPMGSELLSLQEGLRDDSYVGKAVKNIHMDVEDMLYAIGDGNVGYEDIADDDLQEAADKAFDEYESHGYHLGSIMDEMWKRDFGNAFSRWEDALGEKADADEEGERLRPEYQAIVDSASLEGVADKLIERGNPKDMVSFAVNVLESRWPQAEPLIMQDAQAKERYDTWFREKEQLVPYYTQKLEGPNLHPGHPADPTSPDPDGKLNWEEREKIRPELPLGYPKSVDQEGYHKDPYTTYVPRSLEQGEIEPANYEKKYRQETRKPWMLPTRDFLRPDIDPTVPIVPVDDTTDYHGRQDDTQTADWYKKLPWDVRKEFKEGWFMKWPMDKKAGGIDDMLHSYLTAAIWSSNDESDESGGKPLDESISVRALDPKFVEQARKDCEQFYDQAFDLLEDIDFKQMGHDFWLTRNGHGTGFWDRGLGERGDKLTEIAKTFGEVYILEAVPTRNNEGGPGIEPPAMDLDEINEVNPEQEFDRLIKLKDSGEITPEQFQEKSRRLFSMLKLAEGIYPHDPECFCDECLEIDDPMFTHRCPSCGSRECHGDGHTIDCRKPGTMTIKDVPVEDRDSLLDRFNKGEIDEETLRRRMRQISSVQTRWLKRADYNKDEEGGGSSIYGPDADVFYHGSPSGQLIPGKYGIHLGSYLAAKQALEARIGAPAEGEWDGTRTYGETLLAGAKTLENRDISTTGVNATSQDEDYLPQLGTGYYSDGTPVPLDVKPQIKAYRLVGPMSNSPLRPYDDFKANGMMAGQLRQGRARSGYFYTNVSEDAGSISIVVPTAEHLEPLEVTTSSLDGWSKKAAGMPELPSDKKEPCEHDWQPAMGHAYVCSKCGDRRVRPRKFYKEKPEDYWEGPGQMPKESSRQIRAEETALGLRYQWHDSSTGQRLSLQLANAPMGRLWILWLSDPAGKDTQLFAVPDVSNGQLTDRINSAILKKMDDLSGQWIPVDVAQEKELKKQRGPRFEDFFKPEHVRREIIMLLSQDPPNKDYEFERDEYQYSIDFFSQDPEELAGMFGLEYDAQAEADYGETIEEVESFVSDLAREQLRAWGLPGNLYFSSTENGEEALTFSWSLDDIQEFKDKGTINVDPDKRPVMNPQKEIDERLDQYLQAPPEEREQLETEIQKYDRHAELENEEAPQKEA